MLFFLFGGGIRFRDQGPGQQRTCPRCANTATWQRLRRFRELTLFFVPIARWGRRDVESCLVCNETRELPRPEHRPPWRSRHVAA